MAEKFQVAVYIYLLDYIEERKMEGKFFEF